MKPAHSQPHRGLILALVLGSVGVSGSALANPADMFGVGGRNMAMGSAMTGSADDAFAAYYNMAGVGQIKNTTLSIGLQYGAYRFGNPNECPQPSGLVGCSESFYYEHGGTVDIEKVRYGYDNPHNLQLGMAIPLHKRVTLGASVALPVNVSYDEDGRISGVGVSLARLQTLDPYVPSYALYRNRANRFSIYAGLGVEIIDGLYIGAGTSVAAGAYLNLDMGGDAYLTTNNTDDNIAADVLVGVNTQMEMGLTTAATPVAGLLWDLGTLTETLDSWKLGISYRGASSVDVDSKINTDLTVWAQIDAEGEPIAIPVQASGLGLVLSEFYTPRQLNIGLSGSIGERFNAAFDVSWVDWSTYVVPQAMLLIPESDPYLGVNIENVSPRPEVETFYDTWVPRLGLEYVLGPYLTASKLRGMDVALRLGGSYEANPIPEQVGYTNLLNSNRVTGTAGLGFSSRNPFMKTKDKPMSLDLYVQYHYLVPTTHTKNPAVFGSTDPTTVDGYPVGGSYTSQGFALVAGGMASFEF